MQGFDMYDDARHGPDPGRERRLPIRYRTSASGLRVPLGRPTAAGRLIWMGVANAGPAHIAAWLSHARVLHVTSRVRERCGRALHEVCMSLHCSAHSGLGRLCSSSTSCV